VPYWSIHYCASRIAGFPNSISKKLNIAVVKFPRLNAGQHFMMKRVRHHKKRSAKNLGDKKANAAARVGCCSSTPKPGRIGGMRPGNSMQRLRIFFGDTVIYFNSVVVKDTSRDRSRLERGVTIAQE
jgi:hypothetical protein